MDAVVTRAVYKIRQISFSEILKIKVDAKIRKNDLSARISSRVAPNHLLQCMTQRQIALGD